MQELAVALNTAADPKDAGTGLLALETASLKWAEHCLKQFQGKLLKRGLNISRAIAEFEIELQQIELIHKQKES